jgi:hypothetical protein
MADGIASTRTQSRLRARNLVCAHANLFTQMRIPLHRRKSTLVDKIVSTRTRADAGGAGITSRRMGLHQGGWDHIKVDGVTSREGEFIISSSITNSKAWLYISHSYLPHL